MLDIELLPPSERFSITLALPASRYDRLEACASLDVKELTEAHIRIPVQDDMPHLVTSLRIAVNNLTSFNELNFFAARLEALSPQERFIMDGLCYMHGPDNMQDLIHMTYHLDNVMIAGNIEDERQLGVFLLENGFVDFPEDVIPYLDFAKIGSEHLAENTCGIVNGVYYEDNRDEISEVYDGMKLPEQDADGYIFRVRIGNPEHNPDDSLFSELNLPATDEEITDALEFIGVSFPFNRLLRKLR